MMNAEEAAPDLTPREAEILDLARRGYTNNEIAGLLGITRNAVRFHLKEVHSKLGTGSDRGALAAAWKRALAVVGVPIAKFGAPATVSVFAGAMALGGFAAYRSLPSDQANADTPQHVEGVPIIDGRYPNGCPASYSAGTMTLEDFAVGRTTLDALRRLSPDLPLGYLAPDTVVRVPYNADSECGEAALTPAPQQIPPVGGIVIALLPADGAEVTQESTRSLQPGTVNGVCASVEFSRPAVNGQWYRLWLDDVEVTSKSTWVLPGARSDTGRLCYAPAEGLEIGPHTARLSVGDPLGTGPVLVQTIWSFVVRP
jgi:DNA-binding CsgD family transcriptional regulator